MCKYLIYNKLTRKFTSDSGGRNELRPYINVAYWKLLMSNKKISDHNIVAATDYFRI